LAQGKELDNLEMALEDMGEDQSSPEGVKLKSKLLGMRQEWDKKMKVTQEKMDSLSADVINFKEYERAVEKLEPLLERLDTAVKDSERKGIKCDDLDTMLKMLAGNKVSFYI